MIKLLFTSLFVFSLLSAIPAQTTGNTSGRKVAFFNRYALSDSRSGIKKLVDAEISAINHGFISEADDKKRKEISERVYKVRFKLFVEPVLNEIKASFRQVEIQNNIIILEGSQLEENGSLLAVDLRLDISKEFIAYYSNKAKNSDTVLKLDIPETKIGLINTKFFYDKDNGVNGLAGIKVDSIAADGICFDKTVCPQISTTMARIYKLMQEFKTREGYSFILDSSKNLPSELNGFPTTDLTEKFISEYNKSNQ